MDRYSRETLTDFLSVQPAGIGPPLRYHLLKHCYLQLWILITECSGIIEYRKSGRLSSDGRVLGRGVLTSGWCGGCEVKQGYTPVSQEIIGILSQLQEVAAADRGST